MSKKKRNKNKKNRNQRGNTKSKIANFDKNYFTIDVIPGVRKKNKKLIKENYYDQSNKDIINTRRKTKSINRNRESRRRESLIESNSNYFDSSKLRESYRLNEKIRVCTERNKRRIVLFKTGMVGKGKKHTKKRLFTEKSSIKCKE